MSHRSTSGRLLKAMAMALVLATPFSVGEVAADSAESKKIFTQRCMACHSFGKGVKIGPDLRGVTERRPREWLVKFIRSSQSMIAAGDPVAVEIFQQFKLQQMPDWLDLSDEQIGDLLDWLAANGPDQRDGDSRLATSASAAEIESGRLLFHGGKAFSKGGTACAGCHAVDDSAGPAGGTLGPELTAAYALYQEGALTQVLKRPCTQRLPEAQDTAFLSSDEAFALKAYLYSVGDKRSRPSDSASASAEHDKKDTAAAAGVSPEAPPPAAPTAGTAAAAATPAATATAPTVNAPRPARWVPQRRDRIVGTSATGGELVFGALPYAALGLFFLGLGVRYARGKRRDGALEEEAREAWQIYGGGTRRSGSGSGSESASESESGSVSGSASESGSGLRPIGWAWRLGVAATALAHVIGLALPAVVAGFASSPWRLYLLEGSGFLFGALMLVGLLPLLGRALTRDAGHGKRWRELADCLFLSGLFVAVLSGLATAVLYRWGALWSAGTMTPYLQSLARGAPAAGLIEQLPLLVRIHVMAWLVLIALAPATSAASIVLLGLERALALLAPPLAAVGRGADRVRARLSPAAWLWPEEDRVQPLAAGEVAGDAEPSLSSPSSPRTP